MELQSFLSRLEKVKSCGQNEWKARCPAHNDSNPSLYISEHNGKILLDCKVGCLQEAITNAMGLKTSDLFTDNGAGGKQTQPREIGKREHIYHNEDGAPVAKKTVISYDDGSKRAQWSKQQGSGWTSGLDGLKPPLYNLPEILSARGVVLMPEGEKDVETLKDMGYTATTTPNGAGSKWSEEYCKYLTGRDVLVLSDNDAAGDTHAETVATALVGVAQSVKVIPATAIDPSVKYKGDISDIVQAYGAGTAKAMLEAAISKAKEYSAEETVLFSARAKTAAEFGEDNTHFLWYPYFPVGDYTVLMADGGTGKTIFCCGVAANISNGTKLPGDRVKRIAEKVLIISAEDRGELLKKRLANSGADLNNVLIIDCEASEGMNFTDKLPDFEAEVKRSGAKLVIVDPWHAFIGEGTDINRVNCVRPVFQKLANMSKRCDCALVLISHVNKRAQGENANNAATGSTDFINAARSAIRIIFDEEDEDCRIAVHTKTNYAAYGQSVKYRIVDGGLEWSGYSEITRATLEEAARKKTTAANLKAAQSITGKSNQELIEAVIGEAPDCYLDSVVRLTYSELKEKYGSEIFGSRQPKRALDDIAGELLVHHGIAIKTGVKVKRGTTTENGFTIQLVGENEAVS